MTLDRTMADLSQITTIRKSVFLAVPKERVWEFLTKSDLLGKWFHPSDADLTKGGDYTLRSQKDGDRMCWGKVIDATPHDYMKWDFTVGPMEGQMSTVEWELADAPGGTRLTLTHSGLPTHVDGFGLIMALDKGWHGFLANLHDMH